MTLGGRLAGLCDSLLDLEPPLLLQNHNLEAVKVVQCPSLLRGADLLGVCGLRPLLLDTRLLPGLSDDAGAGASGKRRNDDRCKGDVAEREGLAGDVRRIDQDLMDLATGSSKGDYEGRTRLWSTISTIVASLPAEGPLLSRITRPSSTLLWAKKDRSSARNLAKGKFVGHTATGTSGLRTTLLVW